MLKLKIMIDKPTIKLYLIQFNIVYLPYMNEY